MHLLRGNSLQEESVMYYFPPLKCSLEKPQLFVVSRNACESQVWLLKSMQLSSV